MNYVTSLAIGNPTRKYVLTRLADRADERFSCNPSVKLLAAEVELKERQIQNHLAALRGAGLVSDRVTERTDGSQTTNRYYLHGPWDDFGGTGVPFPTITTPKEARAALWAQSPAEGTFRSGTVAAKVLAADISAAQQGVHSSAPPRVQHSAPPPVHSSAPLPLHSAAPLEPSVVITSLKNNDPSVRPSGPVGDARATETTDGGTDGRVIEEQREQGGGVPAASGAGVPAPTVEAFWVIGQIGRLEPKLAGIAGKPLTDQARKVDGLLAAGYEPVELAQLLGVPIDVVRTTAANVISHRIGELPGTPPRLPAQAAAWDGPRAWEQKSVVDFSSTEAANRPVRAAFAPPPLANCDGDEGMCPRLAIRGEAMCGEHLGWDHCPKCVTRWLRPDQRLCTECATAEFTDAGYEAAVQRAAQAAGEVETAEYYDGGQFLRDAAGTGASPF